MLLNRWKRELCWSVCVCVGPYRRPRPMYCILYTHHSRVWRNQWSLFLLANWLHQFLKCTKWHAALLRSSIKFVILVSPHLCWRFVGNRIGPWLASTTSQFLCSFFVILDGIDIKIIDSRWIWSVKLGDCYFLRVCSSNLNRKDNILVLQKRTMKYSLIWSSLSYTVVSSPSTTIIAFGLWCLATFRMVLSHFDLGWQQNESSNFLSSLWIIELFRCVMLYLNIFHSTKPLQK